MSLPSLFIFILIYLIMFTLNALMPIVYGDDYLYSFIWTEQTRFYQPLSESAQLVSSFYDIAVSQWNHYFTWSGRLIAHFLAQIFLFQGKIFFDFINPLVVIFLIMEIYWISNKGKISLDFKPSRLIYIFFILFTLSPAFPAIYLWLTASCNYLWTTAIFLAFLLPYVGKFFGSDSTHSATLMFFAGIIAGWTNENTVCWFILVIAAMIYQYRKLCIGGGYKLETWIISGFIGLCVGYALLICAPGNAERFAFSISNYAEYKKNNLSNASLMMFFAIWTQMLLWYFLWGTFRNRKNFGNSDNVKHSMLMIKIFVFISIASNLIMFLSPEFPARSLFPSFVYLLIAITTSIRMQHEIGKNQLDDKARKFLHIVGIGVFSVVLCTTVMGLSSFRQNDCRIQQITDLARTMQSTNIVEVSDFKYVDWIGKTSLFHLPNFELEKDENHWANIVYARYNNIKGIRIFEPLRK